MECNSELIKALVKFQGEVGVVHQGKTANAGKFSYKYADLASIWDAIRLPLSKNGLCVSHLIIPSDGGACPFDVLETVLMHESGQSLKSSIQLKIEGGRLQGFQAMGSAITYARRYAISSLLGIVTEEDDDGYQASGYSNDSRARSAENNRTPFSERSYGQKNPTKEKVSISQAQEIESLIDASSTDRNRFLNHYGISKVSELLKENFKEASYKLNKKSETPNAAAGS